MRKPVYKFFRNVLLVLLLVILGYSPIFYFNIYEDPFGVFTSDFSSRRVEPNNHFVKMRYVLSNDTGFDSFIFGSSRANNVNPKKFSNGSYYNMYYSLGIPKEHLNDIKMLAGNGCKIKNVIVFLDYASYTTTDTNRIKESLRRPFPEKKMEQFKSYIYYAFQIPTYEYYESYYKSPLVPGYKNMYITGCAENKVAEEFIENNRAQHISDPKFDKPYLGYENKVEYAIGHLKELKNFCDSNKINLTFAMNPTHKTTFLANNTELYFDFMKQLAAISEYYDFSGINKITCNNYFYYEASHYRPIVGNAMIDYIQFQKKIDSIPDFGFLVTKQNVSERIAYHKQQIQSVPKP